MEHGICLLQLPRAWNIYQILPEARLEQLENCRYILASTATSIISLNISTLKTASALPQFLQSRFKMPAKS
jgi:hypothetical protein